MEAWQPDRVMVAAERTFLLERCRMVSYCRPCSRGLRVQPVQVTGVPWLPSIKSPKLQLRLYLICPTSGRLDFFASSFGFDRRATTRAIASFSNGDSGCAFLKPKE